MQSQFKEIYSNDCYVLQYGVASNPTRENVELLRRIFAGIRIVQLYNITKDKVQKLFTGDIQVRLLKDALCVAFLFQFHFHFSLSPQINSNLLAFNLSGYICFMYQKSVCSLETLILKQNGHYFFIAKNTRLYFPSAQWWYM